MIGMQKVVIVTTTATSFEASKFVGGEILYHRDSRHYYQTINRCSGKSPEGWLDGWTYVRVKDLFGNQTAFEVDCDPYEFRMYFRPDSLFDSDWILIRAVTL